MDPGAHRYKEGLKVELEMKLSKISAEQLGRRLEIEQERLKISTESMDAQQAAQQARVSQLRALYELKRSQVESLKVRAGDAALDGLLPLGARPDLSVDGTVELEHLDDVVYVGRPAFGQPQSTVGLFRLEADGKTAVRVQVKLGRSSVNTIEIVEGLQVGNQVILSDMTAWDAYDRIRLN